MLLAPFPLSRFPARIAHKTRRSWMNLPQEITCPREPVLQDSQEGGRVARGPPGEADPSQEPAAASFFAPASPRRRFPTAPYRGGKCALQRGAAAGAGGLRSRGRPGPGGAAAGGLRAAGGGGSAAGRILTVTVGSSAGVVPASIPGLIQRAIAAWARCSRFNNV